MRIILSRKGFDSANGGIVSPIFENGSLVSFPIPSNDKNKYSELQFEGISYTRLLTDLRYKGREYCHIDPDLDIGRRKKQIESWVPAFGQIDSSASYLKNIGVKKGDLFLFFGNFHFVEYRDGHYRYTKRTGDFYKDNDIQVIWGYLQIGEIIDEPERQKELWWHPHSSKDRICNKTNVIYKAAKRLSFNRKMPGAGLLTFDKKRVLTANNCNKATWRYNTVYSPEHIECNRKNQAKDPKKGIYYAGIWQELGLEESDKCQQWAESIIAG